MNDNSADSRVSIAVCDDDGCFAGLFATMIEKTLGKLEQSCSVKIFTNARDCCAAAETGGFDLIGGDPGGLKGLQPEITVNNLVAAGGLALHTASLHPAVLYALR